jgi:hypothetical protein
MRHQETTAMPHHPSFPPRGTAAGSHPDVIAMVPESAEIGTMDSVNFGAVRCELHIAM